MSTGRVKWFDTKKGYGFIESDDGLDVFVHQKDIQYSRYRVLEEGQRVEFEIQNGPKGKQASKVSLI